MGKGGYLLNADHLRRSALVMVALFYLQISLFKRIL